MKMYLYMCALLSLQPSFMKQSQRAPFLSENSYTPYTTPKMNAIPVHDQRTPSSSASTLSLLV